jgi:hypothetical protein
MEKLKAAVFGLGNVGLNYDLKNNFFKTHIKTLNKKKFFHLVFSVDKDQNQINLVEKYYKIKSYRNIRNCPDINLALAVVSLPTEFHFEKCKEILQKFSPKVLLLEKPGCKNLIELKKIFNICKEKKCYLAINYIRRYDSSIEKIKRKFFSKKNVIENFKYLKVYYSGTLTNTCSHYINLINFFINDFNDKKIKIIKSKDDFIIEKIYNNKKKKFFFFFKRKNLTNDEIIFVFKNYRIKYNNKNGAFMIFDYKSSSIINTDLKNYQNSVYDIVIKYFRKKITKINSSYEDAAITHKILRKL